MSGEAVSYLGTAVIVGVTALEIGDLCATLKDISALKRAFNPSFQRSKEELEDYSIKLPLKEKIVAAIKASPQKAWVAPKEALPNVDELKDMGMREVDWSVLWGKTKEGGSDILCNACEGMCNFEYKVKKWCAGN